MANPISQSQKDYLKEQLRYDHADHAPPPGTLVVHQMAHDLITRCVQHYAADHPVHMLDVGCGWGDFSEQLDPYLKSYIGIDPSLSELRQFKHRPNRFLVYGVAEYADFIKDNACNFVLLCSVLDHCYDWRRAFSQCLRILSPGGLIVVCMENSYKLPVKVRKWLGRPVVHEGHLSYWSADEIERLLNPHGQVLEKRTFGYLFGLHALTKIIPLPLSCLRVANQAANQVFRLLDPKGGQVLFVSAIRGGDLSVETHFDAPWQCSTCKGDLAFGVRTCPQCGLVLPYIEGTIWDTLEMNKSLKAELGLG